MTYTEVKIVLQELGLKEAAAQNWAIRLTQDNKKPSREEIEAFVKGKLAGARQREQERKSRRPAEMLTTPEEKFRN